MFPIFVLEGMSHASFMDRSMLPSFVVSSDINPEVEENVGHNMASKVIMDFV